MKTEVNRNAESASGTRLLRAAKHLFATLGYRQATTAAIALQAHTSESQLVRRFGGKAGLLEAVLNDGWEQALQVATPAMAGEPMPARKLQVLSETLYYVMEQDGELKRLWLLEGRHRDEQGRIRLSAGYRRFVAVVDGILESAGQQQQACSGFAYPIIRSALIGLMEGLWRDRLLAAEKSTPGAQYDPGEIQQLFRLVLSAFVRERKPGAF